MGNVCSSPSHTITEYESSVEDTKLQANVAGGNTSKDVTTLLNQIKLLEKQVAEYKEALKDESKKPLDLENLTLSVADNVSSAESTKSSLKIQQGKEVEFNAWLTSQDPYAAAAISGEQFFSAADIRRRLGADGQRSLSTHSSRSSSSGKRRSSMFSSQRDGSLVKVEILQSDVLVTSRHNSINCTTSQIIRSKIDNAQVEFAPQLSVFNADIYQEATEVYAFLSGRKINDGQEEWMVCMGHGDFDILPHAEFLRKFEAVYGTRYKYRKRSCVFAKQMSASFKVKDGDSYLIGSAMDFVVQDLDSSTQVIVAPERFVQKYQRLYGNKFRETSDDLVSKEINAFTHASFSGLVGEQVQDSDIVASMLEQVENRSFDVFELAEYTKMPLTALSMHIFTKLDLVESLGLEDKTTKKYMETCEESYYANPYHNAMHAADVFHCSFIFAQIEFVYNMLSDLEVLALLVAAAVHDISHPGTTNGFQVQTCAMIAIDYNDISVLENFHAATAFKIMMRRECAFLSPMNVDDFQFIRRCIIECVLATDLSKGPHNISEWNRMLKKEPSFADEESKLQLLRILLCCADINHASKNFDQHLSWSQRIMQEFSDQAAKEKALGLNVSIVIDSTPQGVAKSQLGFVNFIAMPLYKALAKAMDVSAWTHGLNKNVEEWTRRLSSTYRQEPSILVEQHTYTFVPRTRDAQRIPQSQPNNLDRFHSRDDE